MKESRWGRGGRERERETRCALNPDRYRAAAHPHSPLSLYLRIYTRAPLFAPTRREEKVWWNRCMPSRIRAYVCRTCLNASRIAQPGSVYYFRACAFLRGHPLIHGSAAPGGGGRRGEAAKDRAGIGPRGGDGWRARGDGGGGGVGCARSSAARCTHSRWGIPRRRARLVDAERRRESGSSGCPARGVD